MSNQSMEERAHRYLAKRNDGLTYDQVGQLFGISGDAVRGVIRRYNQKHSTPIEDMTRENTPQHSHRHDMKILTFDIETAPATGYYWGPKTHFIPMGNMIEDGRIICFAAKWLDGPMMFSSEWDHGREGMLDLLFHLLNEADIVITYNGDSFDIPYANTEFFKMGLGRPLPFKSIDLIKTVRKEFRFMYKKLDFLSQQILGERKIETGGLSLWRALLEDDSSEAKDLFKEYNKKDVDLTEKLYYELRPYISSHPVVDPLNADGDSPACRACGSEDLEHVGWKYALMFRYPMYKCRECSSLVRTTIGGERFANTFSI